MSDVVLTKEEMEENKEVFEFITKLSPELQEKLKTIMWWENLKTKGA